MRPGRGLRQRPLPLGSLRAGEGKTIPCTGRQASPKTVRLHIRHADLA